MDQGVLENLKYRCQKHLLRKLLLGNSEHDSFMQYSKNLTIKDVVYLNAKSWDEISTISLSHAREQARLWSGLW